MKTESLTCVPVLEKEPQNPLVSQPCPQSHMVTRELGSWSTCVPCLAFAQTPKRSVGWAPYVSFHICEMGLIIERQRTRKLISGMICTLSGPLLTASKPGMRRLMIPTEGVAQLGNIITHPFWAPKVLPVLAADLAGHYEPSLSSSSHCICPSRICSPKMGLQHLCLRGFIPHDKKTTPS